MASVSRETCTKCKAEPRRKGQRWGNKCFAKFQRKWSKGNTKLRRAVKSLAQRYSRAA